MGDAVEIPRQVRVYHLGMPRPKQPLDLANGVQGAATRAIGVLFGLQVGLENRFQNQHRSHLYHTVSDARDAQRSLLAIRFRDEHTPHRLGLVRSVSEFFRQFVPPLVASQLLDVVEALAVDPWHATISQAADKGPLQTSRRYTLSYRA